MIARVWHGVVPESQADDYLDYLNLTGVPDCRSTPGNQGVYVLQRHQNSETHFLLISLWESRQAIAAFAGEDIEKARYYPEDSRYLVELEPEVTHFEVAVSL